MKKHYILSLITLLITFGACNKVELEDSDPNNFSDASADLLITEPMLANALVVEGELARLVNIFSNQFTGADRQYISYNSYNVTSGDFDNIWGTLYADGYGQCKLIKEKALAANEPELAAVAKVVESSLIGVAATLWGDVPYSQAGDVDTYPEPEYDPQEEVYANLIDTLKSAISVLGDATVEDLGYASETVDESVRSTMTWKAVAYSLMARFYLHLGDYTNALAAAKLGISSSDEDWMINHDDGDEWIDGKMNIYWNFCEWNRYGYLGAADAYLPELLTSREDVRYDYYYFSDATALDPYTWYGGIFENYAPFPVITYYETELIKAECILLTGGTSANAITELNKVRSYWDNRVGSGDGETFPAYSTSDFSTKAALLKEILTEKYISCYGQIEAFADITRTDNYIGIPLKTGKTTLPERLIYPQSEINSNDNVPTVVDIYTATPANTGTYSGI